MSARRLNVSAAALAAVDASDELRGRAGFRSIQPRPKIARYTKEPWRRERPPPMHRPANRSVSCQGRDIPQEWWTLFKSPALNALIARSLDNNPNLQSTIATLRAGKRSRLRAGGQVLPASSRRISTRRAQTSALDFAGARLRRQHLSISYTAQGASVVHVRHLGLNRRTVESLQAMADVPALPGRSRLPDVDLERRRSRRSRKHRCAARSTPPTS